MIVETTFLTKPAKDEKNALTSNKKKRSRCIQSIFINTVKHFLARFSGKMHIFRLLWGAKTASNALLSQNLGWSRLFIYILLRENEIYS